MEAQARQLAPLAGVAARAGPDTDYAQARFRSAARMEHGQQSYPQPVAVPGGEHRARPLAWHRLRFLDAYLALVACIRPQERSHTWYIVHLARTALHLQRERERGRIRESR